MEIIFENSLEYDPESFVEEIEKRNVIEVQGKSVDIKNRRGLLILKMAPTKYFELDGHSGYNNKTQVLLPSAATDGTQFDRCVEAISHYTDIVEDGFQVGTQMTNMPIIKYSFEGLKTLNGIRGDRVVPQGVAARRGFRNACYFEISGIKSYDFGVPEINEPGFRTRVNLLNGFTNRGGRWFPPGFIPTLWYNQVLKTHMYVAGYDIQILGTEVVLKSEEAKIGEIIEVDPTKINTNYSEFYFREPNGAEFSFFEITVDGLEQRFLLHNGDNIHIRFGLFKYPYKGSFSMLYEFLNNLDNYFRNESFNIANSLNLFVADTT